MIYQRISSIKQYQNYIPLGNVAIGITSECRRMKTKKIGCSTIVLLNSRKYIKFSNFATNIMHIWALFAHEKQTNNNNKTSLRAAKALFWNPTNTWNLVMSYYNVWVIASRSLITQKNLWAKQNFRLKRKTIFDIQ